MYHLYMWNLQTFRIIRTKEHWVNVHGSNAITEMVGFSPKRRWAYTFYIYKLFSSQVNISQVYYWYLY